jgi:hypothetical protein
MVFNTPTASFYTGIGSHPQQGRYSQNRSCVFCKGPHPPNKCAIVVDLTTRKSIINKGVLCYNCLSPTHRCAKCPSKYRCRQCGAKHHTTICDNCPTTPHNLPTLPPTPPTQSKMATSTSTC